MSSAADLAPPVRRRLASPHNPWLAAAGLALLCGGLGAALSLARWPLPRVHDEFSYLLAADTFAHGRLANPVHPEWQHFETFHVIQHPTYASKYPPGQGAALALGQWLVGTPLAGVWLVSALAAAATYWALLGFTTPRFAWLGGLFWLANAKYQIAWAQSYWGGTLAYLGGALVMGAALRMKRTAHVRDAVAMSCGAVVLAATRPFEGLIFCLAVGVWLFACWFRASTPSWRQRVIRSMLPQAAVLGLGLAALAAYQQAVTGSPWRMPYAVHETAYGRSPLFVWQAEPPKPAYRHQVLDDFHSGWELDWHRRQSTLAGWLATKASMAGGVAEFYFPSFLAIGVLLARPWRWPRLRPVAAIAAATFVCSLAATWNLAHYLAPIGVLLLMASVAGLRRADVLSRRKLGGFRLATALAALQIVLFAMLALRVTRQPQQGWQVERAELANRLEATGQRQLVIVDYGADHDPLEEWVYNAADIDSAPVVWARAMTPECDAELVRYFADRTTWVWQPEAHRLTPLLDAPTRWAGAVSTQLPAESP